MAVKDTHKAFERLTDAGYSKEMSEALLEILGDSRDTLATKSDIAEMATRADVKDLEKETKANLRELELRMRLHLYPVAIVVIGILGALELIPR